MDGLSGKRIAIMACHGFEFSGFGAFPDKIAQAISDGIHKDRAAA